MANHRAIAGLFLALGSLQVGGCNRELFSLEPRIRDQPQQTTPQQTTPQLTPAQRLEQQLNQAIAQGDTATVQRLLQKQVSPRSAIATHGLMHAIAQGRPTLIPVFIQAGVNPNTTSLGGLPLRYALQQNQPAAVQALLAAGANPNAQDGNTDSILQEALFMNEYTSFLNRGKPLAHFSTLSPAQVTIIRQLLKAGANPNDRDRSNGTTPLMIAAAHGNDAIIRLLLQKGAQVNAKNTYGETALMYGALRGNPTAVKTLLQAGATVNGANHLGQTALIFAVQRGSVPVAQLLLANGANPRAASRETFTTPSRIDYRQQTVLDHAKAAGNPAMTALIERSLR